MSTISVQHNSPFTITSHCGLSHPAFVEEITAHPAWHAKELNDAEVRKILSNQSLGSYILYPNSKDKLFPYMISYIVLEGTEKGEVVHQNFFWNKDHGGWVCFNSSTHKANTLDELIPKMMHATPHNKSLIHPILEARIG